MAKLSGRRYQFALEYLVDLNPTQAAIRAHYSKKGVSSRASRLMAMPEVKQYIEQELKWRRARLEVTAERVLEGIAKLAFFDIRKLFNDDGSLKSIVELDEDTATAIQGFDVEELFEHFQKGGAKEIGTVKKVKLADRGLNLERLGRHLKLFTDKVEVTGLDALADELAKARQRAQKK